MAREPPLQSPPCQTIEDASLANPELGAKQICPTCSSKFYDLNRRPAHCPKCGAEFDPEEALRSRRVRVRPLAADEDETETVAVPPPADVEDGFEAEPDEAPEAGRSRRRGAHRWPTTTDGRRGRRRRAGRGPGRRLRRGRGRARRRRRRRGAVHRGRGRRILRRRDRRPAAGGFERGSLTASLDRRGAPRTRFRGFAPAGSSGWRARHPMARGYSSAGRALEWHSRGQRFELRLAPPSSPGRDPGYASAPNSLRQYRALGAR